MAIVSLAKFTIYGSIRQKEEVLDSLQTLGCSHIVNLTPGTGEGRPQRGYSEEAYQAARYLRSCPIQRRPTLDADVFNFTEFLNEVLFLQKRQEELEDELDHLRKLINEAEPWGDFDQPDPARLRGYRLWFYRFPHDHMEEIRKLDLPVSLVSHDSRFCYIVAFSRTMPEGMPSSPIELDPRGLHGLKQRLQDVEEKLDNLQWQRSEMTHWRVIFESSLDIADDIAAREHAAARSLDTDNIFVIQAWAPKSDVPLIDHFAVERRLVLTVEPPSPDDLPPTKLHNSGLAEGGQSAVTFYITPDYRTWDPSLVMFFSFSLFFGIIVCDAGYGLLLLLTLFLFWNKLGKSEGGSRFRTLLVGVTVGTIGYGALVGNYFGMMVSGDNPLAFFRIPWINPDNQAAAMSLMIAIGALHVVLANLIMAWQYHNSLRALAPIGWSILILGALLVGFEWQSGLDPQHLLLPYAVGLSITGMVLIVLFASGRVWSFRPLALLKRLGDGLKELTGVTKAFGDVLSYLRLFALGLASAQLAVTFNSLAGEMWEFQGFGVLLAIVIIVFGHSLNFVLAVMSGTVHGLRLVCIEFFNWSLKEEGTAFQPFRKKVRT